MEPSSAFRDKPAAGLEVVNGFGKAAGLSQIAELGVLETALALTNTLGVGADFEGLARHSLDEHPEIGVDAGQRRTFGACDVLRPLWRCPMPDPPSRCDDG
ncbi:P1 family peptidase [Streptomyces sp. NPDC056949]|uniref:P1 family peptidase n=1 Tax=Streptomyces sp. NPDC056949 TaxID=3345976 RepID=UPI003626FBAA